MAQVDQFRYPYRKMPFCYEVVLDVRVYDRSFVRTHMRLSAYNTVHLYVCLNKNKAKYQQQH